MDTHPTDLNADGFTAITEALQRFQLRVTSVLIEYEEDLPLEVRQTFRHALSDFVYVAGEHLDLNAMLDEADEQVAKARLTEDGAA